MYSSSVFDGRPPRGAFVACLPLAVHARYTRTQLLATGSIGLGSDRGTSNHGSMVFSNRVMARIRSPLSVNM
jgi:hypothetical protein